MSGNMAINLGRPVSGTTSVQENTSTNKNCTEVNMLQKGKSSSGGEKTEFKKEEQTQEQAEAANHRKESNVEEIEFLKEQAQKAINRHQKLEEKNKDLDAHYLYEVKGGKCVNRKRIPVNKFVGNMEKQYRKNQDSNEKFGISTGNEKFPSEIVLSIEDGNFTLQTLDGKTRTMPREEFIEYVKDKSISTIPYEDEKL